MIIGVGTDIVEVERIKMVVERTPSFLKKAFTDKEIEYFSFKKNKYESIAGAFASKEAVSKALNTGIRGFSLQDIEVIHDELGKPEIKLSEKIINRFNLLNHNIHVSISHTEANAIAFVVIEEVLSSGDF
ncbi:MAG: holo-ACP synthase [Clostridium sp.]|nr:holo-ACP synthase [Clostridium sp.]